MDTIKKLYNALISFTSKPQIAYGVSLTIIGVFTAAYVSLALNRYWQFTYFYPDNYYFASTIWQVSRGETPMVLHQFLGNIHIFGDHFHPVIFSLSLLLKLFPYQEIILASMGILYGIGGIFAMLIGFKLLKNRFLTWTLLIAYFLYIGTQNAIIYGFHETNFIPPFFLFTMWAFLTERKKLYWLGIALLLLTKESVPVIVTTIGIFIVLAYPKQRKIGLITIAIAIVYFLVVTKLVIPHFNGGRFLYSTIDKPPTNPVEFVNKFIDPPEKIQTFTVSMLTFGLLPLLNIAAVGIVLQDFFVRYLFAIPGNVQYTLGFHYNLALAPLLFFSAVYSLHHIEKRVEKRPMWQFILPVWAIFIVFMNFYYNFMGHQRGPILMAFNSGLYSGTKDNAFLWKLVENTPKTGTVITQNHLGYIFSRQKAYNFNNEMCKMRGWNPDYIVFDLRKDQNPNNFATLGEDLMRQHAKTFLDNKEEFKTIFHEGEMYILKRTAPLPLKDSCQ